MTIRYGTTHAAFKSYWGGIKQKPGTRLGPHSAGHGTSAPRAPLIPHAIYRAWVLVADSGLSIVRVAGGLKLTSPFTQLPKSPITRCHGLHLSGAN